MSESAWCDLNKDETILKLHDKCPKTNCACQKQITFINSRSIPEAIPDQYMLEGGPIKKKFGEKF